MIACIVSRLVTKSRCCSFGWYQSLYFIFGSFINNPSSINVRIKSLSVTVNGQLVEGYATSIEVPPHVIVQHGFYVGRNESVEHLRFRIVKKKKHSIPTQICFEKYPRMYSVVCVKFINGATFVGEWNVTALSTVTVLDDRQLTAFNSKSCAVAQGGRATVYLGQYPQCRPEQEQGVYHEVKSGTTLQWPGSQSYSDRLPVQVSLFKNIL